MQLLSASYGIQSRMSISPVDWIWYPNEGFYSSQCAQYYGSSRRSDQKGSEKIKSIIEELYNDPLTKQAAEHINPKDSRIYAALLEAARKFGLDDQLEAWRTT